MASCWSIESHDRPTFHDLVGTLDTLLEKNSDYMQLAHSLQWKETGSPLLSISGVDTIDECDDGKTVELTNSVEAQEISS